MYVPTVIIGALSTIAFALIVAAYGAFVQVRVDVSRIETKLDMHLRQDRRGPMGQQKRLDLAAEADS